MIGCSKQGSLRRRNTSTRSIYYLFATNSTPNPRSEVLILILCTCTSSAQHSPRWTCLAFIDFPPRLLGACLTDMTWNPLPGFARNSTSSYDYSEPLPISFAVPVGLGGSTILISLAQHAALIRQIEPSILGCEKYFTFKIVTN